MDDFTIEVDDGTSGTPDKREFYYEPPQEEFSLRNFLIGVQIICVVGIIFCAIAIQIHLHH